MKIVLDTNCLLVIIPKLSIYRKVYDLIREGKITLAVTTEILAEYEEQLSNFYSETVAQNVIRQIIELQSTELKTVFYTWNLITKDPDDNKFVDCAIVASAELIVTNDKHFKVLDKISFPNVKHLKLEKFCKLF
ncbi:MAG: putative toxin-antitoxin system toxin component, PIN family [Mariniphaga sp.]